MTLPLIRLSDGELSSGALDPLTSLLARQAFDSKGVIIITNAFTPDFIASLRDEFMAGYARHLVDQETDETLTVGDKRIMMPVEISGRFNTPYLYANPFVLSLVRAILGENCVLGSLGSVTALPGAEEQHIHRDHPFLFNDEAIDTLMPAYAVNAIVPLVDVDEHRGTTRVWLGSHRVWRDADARQLPFDDLATSVGSCVLMDYRLLHGGTANAKHVRPILYVIYQRPWFKDYVNFKKVREIRASAEDHKKIPTAYRAWFTMNTVK
jgi:ectoine hydroxylase-related dioxygenase (phytanoyl-CoA dioxygenase family)